MPIGEVEEEKGFWSWEHGDENLRGACRKRQPPTRVDIPFQKMLTTTPSPSSPGPPGRRA